MVELWKLDNTPQLDLTDMRTAAWAAYNQAMDRGDLDAISVAEQRLAGIYEAQPELRTQDEQTEAQRRQLKFNGTMYGTTGDPYNPALGGNDF
jgi:hypothetical protein